MPDLDFQVENAEPQRFAAAPLLRFGLRVAEAAAAGAAPTPIHSVALRCQVRIEPARRRKLLGRLVRSQTRKRRLSGRDRSFWTAKVLAGPGE